MQVKKTTFDKGHEKTYNVDPQIEIEVYISTLIVEVSFRLIGSLMSINKDEYCKDIYLK